MRAMDARKHEHRSCFLCRSRIYDSTNDRVLYMDGGQVNKDFEDWWEEYGTRALAFNAKQFAKAGWDGHKIHGVESPIEEEIKLLEGAYEGYGG